MQTQLSTQSLKELLQKAIDQKGKGTFVPKPAEEIAPVVVETVEVAEEPVAIEEVLLPLPAVEATTIPEIVAPVAEALPEIVPEPLLQEPKNAKAEKQLKKSLKELETKNAQTEKALVKQLELSKELSDAIEKQKQALSEKELEIEQYKALVASLTKSQEIVQLDAATLHEEIAASNQDIRETKERLLRLITDKKELEDKVTSLSCEKASLTAKLQSMTLKCAKGDEATLALQDQLKEVAHTLESQSEELASLHQAFCEEQRSSQKQEAKNKELEERLEILQNELVEQHSLNRELESKNSELSFAIEAIKTSQSQELAVSQACLQEQSHMLQEEQNKLRLLSQEHLFTQKRADEQENHLRLLEQHLARRVKECALLSKQLEDLMDRTSELQSSLTQSTHKITALEESVEATKRSEAALRQELDAKISSYKESLRQKEQEVKSLYENVQQKEQTISSLRHVESQFHALEQLLKRSSEIITSSQPLAEEVKVAIQEPSQTDFFSLGTSQKPQPKSLFEFS